MPARRSSRHRAVRRHRPRLLLGVIVASAVVAAGAFLTTTTAARIMWSSGVPPVTGTECLPAPPATDSACPQAPAPASATSTVAGPSPQASGTPPATQRPSSSTRTPSPPPTPARKPAGTHSGPAATRVLKLINAARGQAGLPPYTLTTGLRHSAARHNAVMAGGCGLSHQCPGEPSLGARETAAGVPWTTAGENIGEGGPVANSPDAIAQMAAVLTADMLNEKPPSDGHRQNMLSREFHHIGIAVHRDSSGTVWMTQDFSD